MKPTKKYTVVTGASSGIGRETAKAFANRGRNLIVAARRTENLEALKREVTERHPTLDVVIRTVDLSVRENVYQFYSDLKDFQLETWVNNAGFGNKQRKPTRCHVDTANGIRKWRLFWRSTLKMGDAKVFRKAVPFLFLRGRSRILLFIQRRKS